MELISQYEWAKRKGFSKQYVNQLVKSGRVTLEKGKINPELADKALASTSEPSRTKQLLGEHDNNLHDLLLKARIKNEANKGKLLENKAKLESGELIKADDVRKMAFDTGRVIRDGLLNIPDRIAALVTSISDEQEVHRLITEEIKTVLTALERHHESLP